MEGSITFALVAFGGDKVSSVDAVLVYRLLSFWGELVVGWAWAGWLAMGIRHGRWPRQALDAPVEAAAPADSVQALGLSAATVVGAAPGGSQDRGGEVVP